jgi:DNA-directed RNA polymerase subunit RPC12/RpoP
MSKITFEQNGFSFQCPYCNKRNFYVTPLGHIFIVKTKCAHCGEKVTIKDDATQEP